MTQPSVSPADPAARELIEHGRIEITGRLVDASNVALICTVELSGDTAQAIYKPIAGERPLWDFPDGTLAAREVAAELISGTSGLGHIPPTVLREGPLGPGMVQFWVDDANSDLVDVRGPEDVPADWRAVLHAHDRLGEPVVLAHADHPGVGELAVLDVVVNNADRKGGHVLNGPDGRVYGVDHGICLHTEPKLRTVLWGWAGEQLPTNAVEKLAKLKTELAGDLSEQLSGYLAKEEIHALAERVDALLLAPVFPTPTEDWRAIPWPLF